MDQHATKESARLLTRFDPPELEAGANVAVDTWANGTKARA